MSKFGFVLCPHLKGSMEGSVCSVTSNFIKDMEGFTIKLCMSQRHETCSVYMQSLHNMIEYGAYVAPVKGY